MAKETLDTFSKLMKDYGSSSAAPEYHHTGPSVPSVGSGFIYPTTGGGSSGFYPPPTPTVKPILMADERLLQAVERIAKALEDIVERFC